MADKPVFTRRQAATLLGAAPLAAQVGIAQARPDENAEAREGQKQTIDRLRSIRVPMGTEPSFFFRP